MRKDAPDGPTIQAASPGIDVKGRHAAECHGIWFMTITDAPQMRKTLRRNGQALPMPAFSRCRTSYLWVRTETWVSLSMVGKEDMEKFTVSRDETIYEAFPDVALTPSGRLVSVFSECTHHRDRSYTRIVFAQSDDRGRTWSAKRPLSEATHGDPAVHPYWNCPRVSTYEEK